jgi:hypothetical protein
VPEELLRGCKLSGGLEKGKKEEAKICLQASSLSTSSEIRLRLIGVQSSEKPPANGLE